MYSLMLLRVGGAAGSFNSNDSSTQGAGLGLAICQEIMVRLGGDIRYVPQDEGNTFVVTLPRSEALAAQ